MGRDFLSDLGRIGKLMCDATLGLFMCALIVEGTALAQAPSDFQPRLAILRSENAVGSLSSQRAILTLWYVANELRVSTQEIPRIIVVLCTPESAMVAKLPTLPKPIPSEGVAAILRDDVSGEPVYFLWIIGKNPELWLSHGMVNILSLQLGIDPATEKESIVRVLRKLSATTSGAELKASKADFPHIRASKLP